MFFLTLIFHHSTSSVLQNMGMQMPMFTGANQQVRDLLTNIYLHILHMYIEKSHLISSPMYTLPPYSFLLYAVLIRKVQ